MEMRFLISCLYQVVSLSFTFCDPRTGCSGTEPNLYFRRLKAVHYDRNVALSCILHPYQFVICSLLVTLHVMFNVDLFLGSGLIRHIYCERFANRKYFNEASSGYNSFGVVIWIFPRDSCSLCLRPSLYLIWKTPSVIQPRLSSSEVIGPVLQLSICCSARSRNIFTADHKSQNDVVTFPGTVKNSSSHNFTAVQTCCDIRVRNCTCGRTVHTQVFQLVAAVLYVVGGLRRVGGDKKLRAHSL